MQNLQSILDQLEFFWKRRSSFKALIAFIIVINSIYSVIVSAIYFVLNELDYFIAESNFRNFIFFIFIVGSSLNIIFILTWIYWRRVPKISPKKMHMN